MPFLTSLMLIHWLCAPCFRHDLLQVQESPLVRNLPVAPARRRAKVLCVYDFAQSGHCFECCTNSTSNVCCKIVLSIASCCTVIFNLILLEWGSVQMNEASIMRVLLRPRSFRRHKASSSRDSRAATNHWAGGPNHLSQSLHWCSTPSLSMPSVMSTVSFKQSPQRVPPGCVPSIGAPQL